MISFKTRTITLAVIASLASGCATAPGSPFEGIANKAKETFASEDPCSNNARNIGLAAGVLAGLVIGKSVGGQDGLAAGALIGGLVGRLIGADMDRKRCELSKIAKQYNLDMALTAISEPSASTQTASPQQSPAQQQQTASHAAPVVIGSMLIVRSKDADEQATQFEVGSDKLTQKGKDAFAAIAMQYTAQGMLGDKSDAKTKEEVGKQLADRKLFLIGHTDDTGVSQLNAALSERRAKTVAAYLKQHGIAESSLYYQGAGETMPIADNSTDLGRAQNRRVELIEIANETSFKKYLEARKPKYEFYRPTPSTVTETASTQNPTDAKSKQNNATVTTASTAPMARPKEAAVRPAGAVIDFGGVPYSTKEATLQVAPVIPEKTAFSFLSKAYASDAAILSDCSLDRPRTGGSVKSLSSGKEYKTSEHIPQLYGKTWATDVNGNLVVINKLAVLRDGAVPANLPELKIYALYQPNSKKPPEINEKPQVNAYIVGEAVLYRMFTTGAVGLKCADILLPTDGSTTAKGGKILYSVDTKNFVANFKPQMQ